MLRLLVLALPAVVCSLVSYGDPDRPGLNFLSLEDQLDREEDRWGGAGERNCFHMYHHS